MQRGQGPCRLPGEGEGVFLPSLVAARTRVPRRLGEDGWVMVMVLLLHACTARLVTQGVFEGNLLERRAGRDQKARATRRRNASFRTASNVHTFLEAAYMRRSTRRMVRPEGLGPSVSQCEMYSQRWSRGRSSLSIPQGLARPLES